MSSRPLSEQRLLDLATIVERSGRSARSWRRWIAAGMVGVVRIGGGVAVPEDEYEAFLQRNFKPAKISPDLVERILDHTFPRRRGRPRLMTSGGAE